jgi:hypothetical protein
MVLRLEKALDADAAKIHHNERMSSVAGVVFEKRLSLSIEQHLKSDARSNSHLLFADQSRALRTNSAWWRGIGRHAWPRDLGSYPRACRMDGE